MATRVRAVFAAGSFGTPIAYSIFFMVGLRNRSPALCARTASLGVYAGDVVNPLRECVRGGRSAKGDEDGVVAADGAEDVVERRRVDGARQRLRRGGGCLDDDEVAGPLGGEDGVSQELLEAMLARLAGRECRDGSDGDRLRRDVAGRRLDQAELAQVARERRLGDAEAVPAQLLQQLVLGVDGRLADDAEDFLPSAHGVPV